MTKLCIAVSNSIVLKGMEALLQDLALDLIGVCADDELLLETIKAAQPDIVMTDLKLRVGAIGILEIIMMHAESAKVIILADRPELERVLTSVNQMVYGIVIFGPAPSALIECVHQVQRGNRWMDPGLDFAALRGAPEPDHLAATSSLLTPRELEVVGLVVSGLRNREIAERTRITEGTVKMHLHNIYAKVGIGSRTELLLFAHRSNIGGDKGGDIRASGGGQLPASAFRADARGSRLPYLHRNPVIDAAGTARKASAARAS